MPYGILLLLFLGISGPWISTISAAENNSCIECHQGLSSDFYTGHKYQDYVGSVHDKNGVRCEKCHGGDPSTRDKTAAHQGVYGSKNPKSLVYFKTSPWTCGKCHSHELNNFSRSKHYLKLETSGRGPNCVTCHGSMSTYILRSDQIQEFCVVCHNERMGIPSDKPVEAAETLLFMEQTKMIISWSEEFVKISGIKGDRLVGAERELKRAHQEMSSAKTAWHTFDLKEVKKRLTEAFSAAKRAKETAR